MENWILIVGYDRPDFEAAQKDWIKLHVFLHLAVNVADAIEKFSAQRYIAVIVSYCIAKPRVRRVVQKKPTGDNEGKGTPFAIIGNAVCQLHKK